MFYPGKRGIPQQPVLPKSLIAETNEWVNSHPFICPKRSTQGRSLSSTITFRAEPIETDPCHLFEAPAMNAAPLAAPDHPHPKPTDVENLARIILTFRRQFRYSWEKMVEFVRSIGFVEMRIHEVMGLFARYEHDARMGSRRGVYDTPGIIDGGRYDQPFGGFINAHYVLPRIPQGGRVEQQQPYNPNVRAGDMGRRHSHGSTNATISAPPTPSRRNGFVGEEPRGNAPEQMSNRITGRYNQLPGTARRIPIDRDDRGSSGSMIKIVRQ